MPASKKNEYAVAQSQGLNIRQKPSDLRLYHRHDIPGYTGSQPLNAKNDKGPRLSGTNPMTSSGAAHDILI